jgi:hypothetical protein
MKKSLATIAAIIAFSGNAGATIPVVDIPNLTANAYHELLNLTQFIRSVANQLTQISNEISSLENQATQITQAYTSLRRFGDPRYYIALLKLDELTDTIRSVSSIGQTISEYRQAANGLAALRYSGGGIYSDLEGMKDNWGNAIRFDQNAFRKFGAEQNLLEEENISERDWNTQMSSLQNQLRTAVQNLNSAGDLVSTEKYRGQIDAIHAEINALSGNGAMKGRRLMDMHIGTQSDAARVQEAQRQAEIQNRQQDLKNEARGFARLIGGVQ